MLLRFSALLLFLSCLSAAQETLAPTITYFDRVRIAEFYRLKDAIGEQVWPGWKDAPKAILLISNDHEFLINHPSPGKDFAQTIEDPVLGKVATRKRVFQKNFLATFPVDGVPTIVVGQAENTGHKSTSWVFTLLHEHLHQYQYTRPGYYPGINGLGLQGDDQSGMWMLNYAFPYTEPKVVAAFNEAREAMLAANANRSLLGKANDKVHAFEATLTPPQLKYWHVQLWQEGVARFTEIAAAEAAIKSDPSEDFRALHDFEPYREYARRVKDKTLNELQKISIEKDKRVVVYSFGAVYALILDKSHPRWTRDYLTKALSLPELDSGKHAHHFLNITQTASTMSAKPTK